MRISAPIVLGLLGLIGLGCDSGTTNPYQQASQEIDSAAAALDQDGTDTALDGLEDGDADVDDDSDEAADEAARGDGGVRGGHHGRHGGGRGGHGRHRHGRHHGHGHALLLWYADLDALQVCRDMRETCLMGADTSACDDAARACVQPIFEQAFATMCEEKLAMCAADGAPERPCAHIAKRCGADEPAADAGTPPPPPPDPVTPDAG